MNTTLPPLPLIDGCLFIDNSSWVEGMSTCYRHLQYKSLNLRIADSEKPSLNFGSAIHLALEYRYTNYCNRPVDSQYYNDIGQILTDFFTQHAPPADDWRGLNWAMEVIRQYNEHREVEDFSLLKYNDGVKCPYCNGAGEITKSVKEITKGREELDEEGFSHHSGIKCLWCYGTGKRDIMVELPFAIPLMTYESSDLGTIPVFYCGRIDLPVSIDSRLFITDHKTTGSFEFGVGINYKSFWDQMKMSAQQKGYCWAFEQLTGQRVTGYQVNAVRSTQPPLYVLNGTESTRKSGESQMKKKPADWWNESFQREKYILKPGELNEWKNNITTLVEEFFFHYSRGFLPQKTSWCTSFGRCPYFSVCEMVEEDRGMILNSGLYIDNQWTPLNRIPSQPKQ